MPSGAEPGVLLKVGGSVGVPPSGHKWLALDASGNAKLLSPDGSAASVGGGGGFADVLARAQGLLNSSTIVKAFGTDFDTTSWIATPTVGGTGTATLSTTERGGVINCATGATGASSVIVKPGGTPGLIINPTTELWYVRSRCRLATTIDANTYAGIAINGTGSSVGGWIGGLGNRSTTNFTYDFYNNAGAATVNGSLGVALDTNFHVFEMTGDGTNLKFYIDTILRVTVAIPASTTNPCTLRIDAQNGATAANQQLNVDDLIVCTAG